jgi:hypothetical protein
MFLRYDGEADHSARERRSDGFLILCMSSQMSGGIILRGRVAHALNVFINANAQIPSGLRR